MGRLVDTAGFALLRTTFGEFRMHANAREGLPFRVITHGKIQGSRSPLLRIQSACAASEVFFSEDCDCAEQLRMAFEAIAREGCGIVVHLAQEGRGQGLEAKIRACQLMDQEGLDTVDAYSRLGLAQDVRTYESLPEILQDVGVDSVRLLTNNPTKVDGVVRAGVRVERVVPLLAEATPLRIAYLRSKRERLGHQLPEM